MPQTTVSQSCSVLGIPLSVNASVNSGSGVIADPTIAVAKSGTLSVRGSNTAGTLTLATGHGINTGDIIDVYWAGGRRRHVTVGTVAGNDVPISGGSGDNLPVLTTTVSAMKPESHPFEVTAASADLIGATCDTNATLRFEKADNTLVLEVLLNAGASYLWFYASGVANPFGDNVDHVWMSHDDVNNPHRVRAVATVTP